MGKVMFLLINRYPTELSSDETDRVPANINVKLWDILLYIVGILFYFIDLVTDINVCVKYYQNSRIIEFALTLIFLLIPMLVVTGVSAGMYKQDTWKKKEANDIEINYPLSTIHSSIRIVMLVLQLTSVMRTFEALFYAVKVRLANDKDDVNRRQYYERMLREDSDLALLRIFECFLEAAPQLILQTTLLLHGFENLTIHQSLSIGSSVISMGWCLASYQRAIRFAQHDKENMRWVGSGLQTLWHFLVTLSRVAALSLVSYLFPEWTVLACVIHIGIMFIWVQFCDRSPFCSGTVLGEVAFSLALSFVYLFTYFLPREGRTRYRYTVYYTIYFLENTACAIVWCLYSNFSDTLYYTMLIFTFVPFILGISFMILYYTSFHPRTRSVA